MARLVEVKKFASEAQARMAQSRLQANGLYAIVRPADSGDESGSVAWSEGESALFAREDQLEAVQRILGLGSTPGGQQS